MTDPRTGRRFTLEEATALLPPVTELLESLRTAQEVMEERHESVLASVPGNGGGGSTIEYLAATKTAAVAAGALEEMGVIVRDPSIGLIDFLSERDGQDVYLCWRLGEDGIAWWHSTTSGFSDRRPL